MVGDCTVPKQYQTVPYCTVTTGPGDRATLSSFSPFWGRCLLFLKASHSLYSTKDPSYRAALQPNLVYPLPSTADFLSIPFGDPLRTDNPLAAPRSVAIAIPRLLLPFRASTALTARLCSGTFRSGCPAQKTARQFPGCTCKV